MFILYTTSVKKPKDYYESNLKDIHRKSFENIVVRQLNINYNRKKVDLLVQQVNITIDGIAISDTKPYKFSPIGST